MCQESYCCQKEIEDNWSKYATLLYPNLYRERWGFLSADEHTGLHAIVQLLKDTQEFGWNPKLCEDAPECLTVNHVEGFGKIQESDEQDLVLFSGLLLDLSSNEDHVAGATTFSEGTLGFR